MSLHCLARASRFSFVLIMLSLLLPAGAQAQEQRTAGAKTESSQPDYNDTYQQLNLFGDVFERVRAQYVDPVTDKDLIEKALNGMLSSLDPHSSYLNEKSFADMQVSTSGEFGGLGIEVTMENGLVKVVSPIDDTPAAKAGIKAGDYITQIDDKPVMGMTLNDAVDMMRGKVGSEILLEVAREGEGDTLKFKLVRDTIKIQSVRHRIEGNAGYIRITTFNRNTADALKDAMDDVKAKLGDKLIGYVLDLRNNPGGLLDQAVLVSDAFLDKGEIVSIRGRHEEDTKRENGTPGDWANGLPIVVIINGGSASASEIVSGALQDHKRAILLGTKSFGKGSVQTVIPISGNGAIRLTTARYYTPSGRSIQALGIEPDIVVEQAKIEELTNRTISEADLRGALKPEINGGANKVAPPKDEKAARPAKPGETSKTPTGEGGDLTVQDYQLLRALDLLSGLSLYSQSHNDKDH